MDSMELQYAIDTPESGERYTGTSWSTGVTVAYHDYTVSADFNTDDGIAEDRSCGQGCKVRTIKNMRIPSHE